MIKTGVKQNEVTGLRSKPQVASYSPMVTEAPAALSPELQARGSVFPGLRQLRDTDNWVNTK